jgi:glc operon protein GlcG
MSICRPVYPREPTLLGAVSTVEKSPSLNAREADLRMAVAVVDHAGNVVSADRMDGASLQNIRFAEGKAFASALYRQTTEELGALYKTRPDRYFGIMNMYPGKIYLVGGGVPLAVEGQLSVGSGWPDCPKASTKNRPELGSRPG